MVDFQIREYFGEPQEVTDEEDLASFDYRVPNGEFSVVFGDDGKLSFVDWLPAWLI